jgi:hypothetical protein
MEFRNIDPWTKLESSSIGKGKMMVEFFSALIEFNVCR